MNATRPHPWMSLDEAIDRLESCRESFVEAAEMDPDWATDNIPADAPMHVDAFSINCAFAAAADVAAFDLAIALLCLARARGDKA